MTNTCCEMCYDQGNELRRDCLVCPCHQSEKPQCPHAQTFLVTLPGGKVVERCGACHDIMVVSRKPQPEQWEEEFDRLTNMDLYEKLRWPSEFLFGEDHYPESPYELEPERIKSFIRKLLASQKEQMLEALAAMKSNIKFTRKMVLGGQHTLDSCQGCSQTWSSCVCIERNIGYNSALSDVEERWKAL